MKMRYYFLNLGKKLLAGGMQFFKGETAHYGQDGYLHIPKIKIEGHEGFSSSVLKRIPDHEPPAFQLVELDTVKYGSPLQLPDGNRERVCFVCNICGRRNTDLIPEEVRREKPSCRYCGSNLRFRTIIYALSRALFGKGLLLTEFSKNKDISGIGMSDWHQYAKPLSKRLDYTNTFYHQAPRLDITDIRDHETNAYDFIISSDVFEHVPPPVSVAFDNALELLKPGGVLVLSVPFQKKGTTLEYFPDLHDYEIKPGQDGEYVLENTTALGEHQTFDNLCFHGGPGSTLEMQLFSETGLTAELEKSGFTDIFFHHETVAAFGIFWNQPTGIPVTARKPIEG